MQRGFFSSLFDMSFSSLVTTKVIKVLYVLAMIAIGLTAIGFVIAAFQDSVGLGVVTLVVIAPLISLLYLVYARVFLEIVIAVFRIMESNVELLELQRASSGPEPPAAAPEAPVA